MRSIALAAVKGAPHAVDPAGRILRGVSVATKGVAEGHGGYLDDAFLAALAEKGNAALHGVKCRFGHPSVTRDALGFVLGRLHEFKVDGDRVRADLFLLTSADASPYGHLAEYIIAIAVEDPAALGMSAVFTRDIEQEEVYLAENLMSPDPSNPGNVRHWRMGKLLAIDIVDDPAVNPEGLFASITTSDEALSARFGAPSTSSSSDYPKTLTEWRRAQAGYLLREARARWRTMPIVRMRHPNEEQFMMAVRPLLSRWSSSPQLRAEFAEPMHYVSWSLHEATKG